MAGSKTKTRRKNTSRKLYNTSYKSLAEMVNVLRNERKAVGLTVADMALRMDEDESTVMAIEDGNDFQISDLIGYAMSLGHGVKFCLK